MRRLSHPRSGTISPSTPPSPRQLKSDAFKESGRQERRNQKRFFSCLPAFLIRVIRAPNPPRDCGNRKDLFVGVREVKKHAQPFPTTSDSTSKHVTRGVP